MDSDKTLRNDGFESEAAVKLQKVYRSYRTRRRLADSAVVAEELWWQALDYARLKHRTISFFHFNKPETAASRWSRISLVASKVGKGLSKDAKAKKLAFQHWIEAIDPRHRYGHNLHLYYEDWSNRDSGQPFFYWLDIGDGKEIDLEECPRSKLQQECIRYLGPQERESYEYVIVEGVIRHQRTGVSLNTYEGSKGSKWIFVMSTSKKLYGGEKKKGSFHHSSFLAGGATLAAGQLIAEDGKLRFISAYSGHYRPTNENLSNFLAFLQDNGANLDEVQVLSPEEYHENYKESESLQEVCRSGRSKNNEQPKPRAHAKMMKHQHLRSYKYDQRKSSFKRTLSSNLQSPRTSVPKSEILQRIKSKNEMSSYQLGHQISSKWSTGAGPRIGCVADYPQNVRVKALEFVDLTPRKPATRLISKESNGLASFVSHCRVM